MRELFLAVSNTHIDGLLIPAGSTVELIHLNMKEVKIDGYSKIYQKDEWYSLIECKLEPLSVESIEFTELLFAKKIESLKNLLNEITV